MVTERKPTEERRTEIADAALRIIGTRGIASLTVAALARELGLTGGALYRHYPSTDAILEAVAARAAELLDASLPPPGLAPIAWLTQFAEARATAVGGHAGLARLLFSDQFALALPERALDRLRASVRRSRLALLEVVTAGQASGDIRNDLPAEALVPIVIGTMQMIVQHRVGPLLPRVDGDPLALFQTMLRLLAPVSAQVGAGGGR